MADLTVPPAMVEAGYHAALNAPPCAHFEGDPEREGFATCLGCTTNAVLAAALSVCEVREEWGYRSLWSSYQQGRPDREDWCTHGGRRMAEAFVAEAESVPRVLIHRLVITTPTEEADHDAWVQVCAADYRPGPRGTCPDPVHDWPLPRGYVDAAEVAEARLRRRWRNVPCGQCGLYGWIPGRIDPTTDRLVEATQ